MQRHVIDTDVYIDLIRDGSTIGILEAIYERGAPGLYFSSVVAEELWAGARGTYARKALQDLLAPFEKYGRILTPSHRDWILAGKTLAKILIQETQLKNKIASLSNDCLIAVNAHHAGATVYTRNADDFRRVQSILPFSLVIVH